MRKIHLTSSVSRTESGYFLATLNAHTDGAAMIHFAAWNGDDLEADTTLFSDHSEIVATFPFADPHAALEQILGPLQFREYVYCDNCQARIPRDEAHFGQTSGLDFCGCAACCAEPPVVHVAGLREGGAI